MSRKLTFRTKQETREPRLFGQVLATKREELHLSQSTVARQVGRSQSWVSYYEQGRFAKIPVLADLALWCYVLELNPVELLYECGFLTPGEIERFATELRLRYGTQQRKAA